MATARYLGSGEGSCRRLCPLKDLSLDRSTILRPADGWPELIPILKEIDRTCVSMPSVT